MHTTTLNKLVTGEKAKPKHNNIPLSTFRDFKKPKLKRIESLVITALDRVWP